MEYELDPDEHLDYFWDWSLFLGTTETITSHSFSVDPPLGVIIDQDAVNQTGKVVVAWLSNGVEATLVDVTCHIVTSEGRESDQTMKVWVKQR